MTHNKYLGLQISRKRELIKKVNKKITIARELTKIHEEVLQGSAQELLQMLESNPKKQKGEFVIILSN